MPVATPSELEIPAPEELPDPEPVAENPEPEPVFTENNPMEDNRWTTAAEDVTATPVEPVVETPAPMVPTAPADIVPPEPEPEPEPEKIVPAEPVLTREPTKANSTNRLVLVIVGAIIGTVIIGFTGIQVFSYINSPEIPEVTTTNAVLGEQEVILTIDQSFTAQSLINSVSSGNPGVIEYVLHDTNAELVPTDLALDLVTDNFPTTVQQFGTSVRFISTDQTRPQLLIQITDQISVTGALLTQETNLIDSLAPLFGTSKAGTFMDMNISGTDVRVFISSNGDQGVTYGFIDDTTLLIAGSIEEFEALLQLAE